jgi:putative endonuclease
MRNKRTLGSKGEEKAIDWLKEHGFKILSVNWRDGRFEIDIVASLQDVLHFVEVKTRTSERYGFPEESVTKKKLMHLLKAGEAYQHANPGWKRVQYDVLSVQIRDDSSHEYVFIEDVYL